MSWLVRLKNQADPEAHATEPTKAAFVAFVAPSQGPIQNFAEAAQHSANGIAPDPDGYCWPHSDAMSGAEIDRLTARVARFTDKGMTLTDAERVAEKLMIRDRDGDDRRLCLECSNLSGRVGRWQCDAWPRAGIGDHAVPGDLVAMPQRCAGFADNREKAKAPPVKATTADQSFSREPQ